MVNLLVLAMTFPDPEDRSRFERLVKMHWNKMVNVSNRVLGNKEDAEDAAQEAYIKLYLNYSKYRDLDDDKMLALLYTITKNCALNIYQSNRSKYDSVVPFGDEINLLSVDISFDNSLEEAIAKLKESFQEVIYLRYVYGYEVPEIADLLGINTKAAYKRLERAKASLAEKMGKEELR